MWCWCSMGSGRVFWKVAEMAEIDPGAMMTGGAARVKSFQAEEKISSAISGLVQGKPAKVYVTAWVGGVQFNLL